MLTALTTAGEAQKKRRCSHRNQRHHGHLTLLPPLTRQSALSAVAMRSESHVVVSAAAIPVARQPIAVPFLSTTPTPPCTKPTPIEVQVPADLANPISWLGRAGCCCMWSRRRRRHGLHGLHRPHALLHIRPRRCRCRRTWSRRWRWRGLHGLLRPHALLRIHPWRRRCRCTWSLRRWQHGLHGLLRPHALLCILPWRLRLHSLLRRPRRRRRHGLLASQRSPLRPSQTPSPPPLPTHL